MPKVVKTYAVNATGNTTVYTCPASTTAKVIVSYLRVVSAVSASAALNVGLVSYTSSASSSAVVALNDSVSQSGSGTTTISPAAPIEIYLTAGQTIATVISGGSVKAQICVIEVS